MSRHFTQSYIRRVRACLAVTSHLHFWQNDRDLLRAIAVTRGWDTEIPNLESAEKVDPGDRVCEKADAIADLCSQAEQNHWACR